MKIKTAKKYKKKQVLIVGLGKSGSATLELMALSGANISVYDNKDIEWEDPKTYTKIKQIGATAYLNGKEVPNEKWDYIAISPGVTPQLPFVVEGIKNGAILTGDLELAFEVAQVRFVAITGTNGKTTTTTLTGEMFKNAGIESKVTGNIGKAVIASALEAHQEEVFVTEVSSFQLETIKAFQPKVSAILNVTPDHLDRHGSLENYAEVKAKIFENQKEDGYFVGNADDPIVEKLSKKCKATKMPFSRKKTLSQGTFVQDGRMVLRTPDGEEIDLIAPEELKIPGLHNLENALAAASIAWCGGVPVEYIRKTLKSFKGVEHRLEPVATINGVKFVNDSKGTNPEASMRAIEATKANILLIAGGYDKHSDFHGFIRAFDGKVSQLILLGATAPQIKREAEEEGFTEVSMVDDMGEAVRLAFELAMEGDTVLLSPACASWGMYTCFEERGNHFKKCVRELKKKE
ncbi:MAG: UDP-N-acetylmuramoyl-L-alanine--D-glutamate ligase [Clostridiales Family XIII bacterium]|jgi:UDP-N-acetylmuramoylalanine--D-glutamate ligase|nr:UDP-N-acetylmuramoyl-L-alanine--D-glutamate ligase [Clostridiales Family XIII bacterium]